MRTRGTQTYVSWPFFMVTATYPLPVGFFFSNFWWFSVRESPQQWPNNSGQGFILMYHKLPRNMVNSRYILQIVTNSFGLPVSFQSLRIWHCQRWMDFLFKTPSKLTRGGFGFKAKLEVNFDVNAHWIHGTNGIFTDRHLHS